MSFSPSLNDVLFKLSEILIEITLVPQHSKEIGFKTCHRGSSLLISPPNPQMQIPRKWRTDCLLVKYSPISGHVQFSPVVIQGSIVLLMVLCCVGTFLEILS